MHAKGITLEGEFIPDSLAARLTMAAHMQSLPSKQMARFSNFTGLPDIADNSPHADPRGLALRFTLPDGSTSGPMIAFRSRAYPISVCERK